MLCTQKQFLLNFLKMQPIIRKKMCLLLNGNEYFIVLYSMPVSVD